MKKSISNSNNVVCKPATVSKPSWILFVVLFSSLIQDRFFFSFLLILSLSRYCYKLVKKEGITCCRYAVRLFRNVSLHAWKSLAKSFTILCSYICLIRNVAFVNESFSYICLVCGELKLCFVREINKNNPNLDCSYWNALV